MSRHINVNPGHYKVAGRERQGEDIIQEEQKQAYATQQADGFSDGVPPWEATRHSFVSAQPPEQAPAKKAREAKAKRRTSATERPAARKTTARKTTKKAPRAKKPVDARGTARRPAASRSGLRERRVKRSTRRRAPS